jgi:formylmethanofuran dehydrogenase subunit E
MDYIHYNDIDVYELSDITDPEARQTFALGGSKPICMVCGNTLVSEEYPICCGEAGGYRTCDRCGQRVREEDGHWVDARDEFWCDDCFDERYRVCDRCGAVVDLDEVYEHNGYYYCEVCAVDRGYAVRCDGCGELFDSDDVQSFGDYTYCESCAEENTFVCPECGERCSNEDKECLTDGTEICHDCAEANYERCSICNRYVDAAEYDENDGVCSTCKAAVDRGEYRQCDICGGWYSRYRYKKY